jgi:hypothetical protein
VTAMSVKNRCIVFWDMTPCGRGGGKLIDILKAVKANRVVTRRGSHIFSRQSAHRCR